MDAKKIGREYADFPSREGRVPDDRPDQSPANTDVKLDVQASEKILKPQVFSAGSAGGIQLPGVFGLPAELDHAIFSASDIPALNALSRVSFSCNHATKNYLSPSAQKLIAWQRARYGKRRQRLALQLEVHNRCQLILRDCLRPRNGGTNPTHGSTEELADIAGICNLEKFQYITVPLAKIAISQWPQLITAMTAGGQWRSLILNIGSLAQNEFAEHGFPALAAVHFGADRQRLQLQLGDRLTEDDARAIGDYLRCTPQCICLHFDEQMATVTRDGNELICKPRSLPALEIICGSLLRTSVTEVRVHHELRLENQHLITLLLANPKLKTLEIGTYSLPDSGMAKFTRALAANAGLTSLRFINTELDEQGVLSLCSAVSAHLRLEALEFSCTGFGSETWKKVGLILSANRKLHTIKILCTNFLSWVADKNIPALLSGLSAASHLVSLGMTKIEVTSEVITLLAVIIEKNPALCFIGRLCFDDVALVDPLHAALLKARGPLNVEFERSTASRMLRKKAKASESFLNVVHHLPDTPYSIVPQY